MARSLQVLKFSGRFGEIIKFKKSWNFDDEFGQDFLRMRKIKNSNKISWVLSNTMSRYFLIYSEILIFGVSHLWNKVDDPLSGDPLSGKFSQNSVFALWFALCYINQSTASPEGLQWLPEVKMHFPDCLHGPDVPDRTQGIWKSVVSANPFALQETGYGWSLGEGGISEIAISWEWVMVKRCVMIRYDVI